MFRKFLSFVILVLVLIPLTACSSAKQIALTVDDNGSQVEIKLGGEIIISLNGNPSTGYTWEPNNLDTTMFERVGDPAFTSSNPGLVGSGGTLTLTFKALNAGTSTLTLFYHRPWETGVDPIETFTITVIVK